MFRNGLTSAYNRLTIGNGSIMNFMNLVQNINLTGGIARYTLNRGYFLDNISKNYEGGVEGRYGYGVDAHEKIVDTDGKILRDGEVVPASLNQDLVGDFYTVDPNAHNGTKNFTTIAEFSALGDEIRKLNLKENVKEDTFKDRYGTDEKFVANGVIKTDIGNESVQTTNTEVYNSLFGQKQPLKESSKKYFVNNFVNGEIVKGSTGYFDTEGGNEILGFKSTNPVRQEDGGLEGNSTFKNDLFNADFNKDIREIAKTVRDKYHTYNQPYRNFAVQKRYGKYYSDDPDVLEKINFYNPDRGQYSDKYQVYEPSENNVVLKINGDNLADFYKPLWDKRGPKGVYGVQTTLGRSVYSVGDGIRAKNAIINPKYTSTTFRTESKNSGVNGSEGNYSYFEEATYNGNGITNTSDGFVTDEIRNVSSSSMLLQKTSKMFQNGEIKSLINRFHTDLKDVSQDDQLLSAYDQEKGLSRGRNLRRANNASDDESGFDNPYCRVWTARHQYAKMKDRIRPFMDGGSFMSIEETQKPLGDKMRPNQGAERLGNYSVLQDNGFVKITPYHKDGQLYGGRESLKKYMFSIENLAWKGFATEENLSPEQRGPFGGRIMWFPPYNLQFNENINTEWNSNEFIGRGEKIYTYKNTDRAGTLHFSLLIDHPSILNKWKGMGESDRKKEEEEELLRYFAGCGQLEINEAGADIDKQEKKDESNDDKDTDLKPTEQFIEYSYIMFFPNNFSAKKYYDNIVSAITKIDAYEMPNSGDFNEMDPSWDKQKLQPQNYDNKSVYNLNGGGWKTNPEASNLIEGLLGVKVNDSTHPMKSYSELKSLANDISDEDGIFGYDSKQYELKEVVVTGFASDDGYPAANAILCADRAETIKRIAKYYSSILSDDKFREGENKTVGHKTGDVNVLSSKIARSAIITFRVGLRDDVRPSLLDEEVYGGKSEAAKITAEAPSEYVSRKLHGDEKNPEWTYQNEYMYFEQIKAENNMVYKNIVNKFRFFDPAFHSLTPEGFNARLNFLQQCTRQGPTVGSVNGGHNRNEDNFNKRARNLAFGMAPYCILRIGDFFYSKIVIDSISISYDTGSGVQWDLNPEGVGVQPMYANVDMNFHFIGGQDIDGPVAQLQNAISYNYYANSSIYTSSTQKSIPTWPQDDKQIDKRETN